jgi:hypothetical protein
MGRSFIFKTLLTVIFILMLSPLVRAGVPMKKEIIIVRSSQMKEFTFLIDTARYQRQDEKKDKGKEQPNNKDKPDQKQEPDKPDIKEVPKARKQARPAIVVKPNIKVKPIKIMRPNIKRP